MKNTLYLGASLLALPLGPLLDRWGARARWLRPALDGFVLVMVGALVLLHVVPHALEEAGPWALAAVAVGLFLPAGLESMPIGGAHTSRRWTMALAVMGLALHALLDGAALSTAHGEGDTLALAVMVHRFPVSLFLWWAVGALVNRRAALLALALLGGATVVGFGFGTALVHLADVNNLGLLEATVGGSLLHVLAGHGLEGPRDPHQPPVSARPEAIGALVACGFIALPLGEVFQHSLLHGPIGQRLLQLLLHIAPALLLGYLIAGVVATFGPQPSLRWAGRGGGLSQALRGAFMGLPRAVCSCGVAPAYRGLWKAGLPASAALAFLVATPALGIEAMFLSGSLLGAGLTGVRIAAAGLVALLVGLAVGRMTAPPCHASGPTPSAARAPGLGPRLQRSLRFGLEDVLEDTALWILLGLFLAAFLEPSLVARLSGVLPAGAQIVLVVLAALPLYVCASGATPLAAALIYGGFSPGAAIALLVAGPATNLSDLVMLSRLHGRRVAGALALTVALGAAGLGLAANALWPAHWAPPAIGAPTELLGWVQRLSLGLLSLAFLRIVVLRGPRSLVQALFSRPVRADPAACEDPSCEQEAAQAALPIP